jgi:anthraniloyl-CoA monooxygenase
MKVAVIGGGPAGLFFATLMKRAEPHHDITVYEQNPPGATYGFGVAFTDIALRFLDEADPALHRAIVDAAAHGDHITIVHKGVRVPVGGNVFYGIGRLELLEIMRGAAAEAGVQFLDGRRIESLADFADCDLIVGADGVNSAVRNLLQDHFQAETEFLRNMWVWYGTPRTSPGVNLIFAETADGLFIGHTYRYRDDRNTFVVECPPAVWKRAGLDTMPEAESHAYCGGIFADFLDGAPFLSNRSLWFKPAFVRTRNWTCGNVVLLGDALKTMHPTIGSGTRVAMQDAIALAQAFSDARTDVEKALALFVERRRPNADGFQKAARRSIDWYETVEERLHLSPLDFTYDYMTRTGKVDHARLTRMAPDFVRAYEQARPQVASG